MAEEKRMHWIYLICGGFIIGLIATAFASTLWALCVSLLKYFGVIWTPRRFIQRCWGYW